MGIGNTLKSYERAQACQQENYFKAISISNGTEEQRSRQNPKGKN